MTCAATNTVARRGLLSPDEAVARVEALAHPIREAENVPLNEAVGRLAADPVVTDVPLPLFDHAAMDGYAVNTAHLIGDPPYRLPISRHAAAGDPAEPVTDAPVAVRILTGAPVAAGLNAVVMQETCRREASSVLLFERPRTGQNIRRRGEDVGERQQVIPADALIDARHVALAAACGINALNVRRRVRAAVLSTGNELLEPGAPVTPGRIFDSNRHMLAAMLRCKPWLEVCDLGVVRDDPEAITTTLRDAARHHDLIVSTGGVSVGDEDHLSQVIRSLCQRSEILKIAIKPGKPAAAGSLGRAVVLALPGNPFSAFVTFVLLGAPVLAALSRIGQPAIPWQSGAVAFEDGKQRSRDEFVPVAIDGYDTCGRPWLHRLGTGGSARLLPLAQADGLAVLPASSAGSVLGDVVRFMSFAHAFPPCV